MGRDNPPQGFPAANPAGTAAKGRQVLTHPSGEHREPAWVLVTLFITRPWQRASCQGPVPFPVTITRKSPVLLLCCFLQDARSPPRGPTETPSDRKAPPMHPMPAPRLW